MAYSKARRLAEIVSDTSGNLSVEGIIVPTQSNSDNDTSAASTAFVHAHVNALVDSAPGTLNTLNELADALNDEANFGSTITTAVNAKLPLAGGTLTGNLRIDNSASTAVRLQLNNTGSNDYASIYADTASAYKNLILNPLGGEVLIGKTAADNTTVGIRLLGSAGFGCFVRDGNTPVVLNRLTSDGEILRFDKDGSTVGSIGGGATFLTIGSGTGNVYFQNGVMAPTASSGGASSNGVVDLGTSSSKFKDLHLSGTISSGTITSSGNLVLDATGHNYIELHSSTSNTRKWRFYNGQSWNADALLIYDVDGDASVLTIEPGKLGINKGANSLSHTLDVGGTISSGAITSSDNISITGSIDRRIKLSDSGVVGVSTSDNTVYVRGNDDTLILNAAGNGSIKFQEAGAVRFLIDSTGNGEFYGNLGFEDNKLLMFGGGQDARLYFDATTNALMITASNGTANTVNITANNFQIGGSTPLISGTANDSVVINQDGASNVDFRVESDNEQFNFFCDASSEIIHFGEGTNSDVQSVIPAKTLAGRRHGYHGGNKQHAGQTFKYSETTTWTDAIKIDWHNVSWGAVCMRITGMYYYTASDNFSIVIGFQGYGEVGNSSYGSTSVSYDATSSGAMTWTNAIQLAQSATGETMIRQRAGDSTGDIIYRYEWQCYARSNQPILIIEQ